MSNRMSDLRKKIIEKARADVAPKVRSILQERWENSATCGVSENEVGSSVFKVTRDFCAGVAERVTHVVDVRESKCTSCRKWQEFQCPCVDAVAHCRLHQDKDLEWILRNKVAAVHMCGNQNKILEKNTVPVVKDTL